MRVVLMMVAVLAVGCAFEQRPIRFTEPRFAKLSPEQLVHESRARGRRGDG